MKRRLTFSMVLSIVFITLSAQSTHNARIMKEFSESMRDMSASYNAYIRLWDDLDAPAPRRVKPKADYYKLFVPPTFYLSPVEQAFSYDWEPGDRLVMTATDSIAQIAKAKNPEFELPKFDKAEKVDRWVNRILLDYYVEHPTQVVGNELYFADAIILDDVQVVTVPSKEKIKNYMQVENPMKKASTESEFQVFKPNFWKKSAAASVQFSQHGISDNWYQGGESTNALLAEMKMTANYDNKQGIQFDNSLEMKLGFITAPSDTVHSYKTNADLFRLNSKLGVRAIKNLYYTIASELTTQFFPNYATNTNNLISSFLSPLQFKASVGMDYKLEKSKYKLSLMGAPFSYTFVYISNDDIVNPSSFNVEPGHSSANLFGSEITADVDWKIKDNILYVTKFNYFTTYDKVIMNWENTVEFKLNRYLSTKIFFHLRYDDGVTLTEENDTYFQLKEMLTFGLSYSW